MSSVASSALKNLFGGGQSPLPWRVAATGHEVLVKKPVAQDPTMKTDVHLPLAFLRPARLFGFFFLTALLCAPQASAAAKKDADKKDAEKGVSDNPIVLVPPFENQSKIQQRIAYDVGARDDDRPLRQLMVDRLSQAPRSLLEDLLTNIENVTVVERQRIDSFLVETEFGALSGLVDQEKAAKLGKLLGANLIATSEVTASDRKWSTCSAKFASAFWISPRAPCDFRRPLRAPSSTAKRPLVRRTAPIGVLRRSRRRWRN
jgi:hypothetical protein